MRSIRLRQARSEELTREDIRLITLDQRRREKKVSSYRSQVLNEKKARFDYFIKKSQVDLKRAAEQNRKEKQERADELQKYVTQSKKKASEIENEAKAAAKTADDNAKRLQSFCNFIMKMRMDQTRQKLADQRLKAQEKRAERDKAEAERRNAMGETSQKLADGRLKAQEKREERNEEAAERKKAMDDERLKSQQQITILNQVKIANERKKGLILDQDLKNKAELHNQMMKHRDRIQEQKEDRHASLQAMSVFNMQTKVDAQRLRVAEAATRFEQKSKKDIEALMAPTIADTRAGRLIASGLDVVVFYSVLGSIYTRGGFADLTRNAGYALDGTLVDLPRAAGECVAPALVVVHIAAWMFGADNVASATLAGSTLAHYASLGNEFWLRDTLEKGVELATSMAGRLTQLANLANSSGGAVDKLKKTAMPELKMEHATFIASIFADWRTTAGFLTAVPNIAVTGYYLLTSPVHAVHFALGSVLFYSSMGGLGFTLGVMTKLYLVSQFVFETMRHSNLILFGEQGYEYAKYMGIEASSSMLANFLGAAENMPLDPKTKAFAAIGVVGIGLLSWGMAYYRSGIKQRFSEKTLLMQNLRELYPEWGKDTERLLKKQRDELPKKRPREGCSIMAPAATGVPVPHGHPLLNPFMSGPDDVFMNLLKQMALEFKASCAA